MTVRLAAGVMLGALIGVGLSASPEREPDKMLTLRRVTETPRVDGRAEPVWDATEPFAVSLAGSTSEHPREVFFKALLARDRLYLLASWTLENAASPLVVRTANGDGRWNALGSKHAKFSDYRGQRTLEWRLPLALLDGAVVEGRTVSLPGVALSDEAGIRDLVRMAPFTMRFQGDGTLPKPETLQTGEIVYRSLCSRCHTLDGSEIYWGAKSFNDLNERVGDLELWQNIRFGFADVSAETEERLQALYAYLRSLK